MLPDYQRFADRELGFALILGAPLHVEDLVLLAHKFFGVPVTAQAPLHLQRRSLISDRHLVHPAMTRRAADAFVHVNAVIEIDVVGEIVDTPPLNWFTRAKAGADRFEVRTVGPDLFVAIH